MTGRRKRVRLDRLARTATESEPVLWAQDGEDGDIWSDMDSSDDDPSSDELPPEHTKTSEVQIKEEGETIGPPGTQASQCSSTTSSPQKRRSLPEMGQSAEAYLNEIGAHQHAILQAIIDEEFEEQIGMPCVCESKQPRKYRCRDCGRMCVLCRDCMVERHEQSPFHWAEEWTGNFFKRVNMSSLGLVIHLNHIGTRCPAVIDSEPHSIQVVHTSGIHKCTFVYCSCPKRPDLFVQLLRFSLFPASLRSPQTVFTFALLSEFHLDTGVSKKAAHNYVEVIRKKTNNYIPFPVPDKQFRRITRLWRYYKALLRSGRHHGLDDTYIHRPKGSLAIPCLACPIPGFNVAEPVPKSHKNFKFISADANFHLINLNKNNNPNETSLWDGHGFIRKQEELEKHIKNYSDLKEEKSTCSDFAAIQNANNTLRHQGQNASGLVAILCRHGLCEPQGAVNLQKGERQINVDYALSGALRNLVGLPRINLSYDINCQYSVKIVGRFQKCFQDQVDIIKDNMKFFIGKFHAIAHKNSCQYGFSLAYSYGMGRTDGEEVERFWAEMNQVAGSTKQMGRGNRIDTIDDFIAASNWMKLESMADTLFERRKLAKQWIRVYEALCSDQRTRIEKMYSGETVNTWLNEDPTPHLDEKGMWTSIYELRMNDIPSLQKLSGRKHGTERRHHQGNQKSSSDAETAFMVRSMELQQRQIALRNDPTNHDMQALRAELVSWLEDATCFMPDVTQDVKEMSTESVKDFQLQLPSSIRSPNERKTLGLERLASIEFNLREAEAHDALEQLRQALSALAKINHLKSKYTHGHKGKTRTNHLKEYWTEVKHGTMELYRHSFQCLEALGLSSSGTPLRELKAEHTYRPDIREPHELGSGFKPPGWIWTVATDCLLTNAEPETKEENRVLLVRTRATLDRWKEELDIVEEETRRVVAGFDKWADLWMAAWNTTLELKKFGDAAFCARKSFVFREMANSVRLRCSDAPDFKIDDKPVQGSPPRRHKRKVDELSGSEIV